MLLKLPLALEVATGARNGHRLVHHPLADTQILVDIRLDLGIITGKLIGPEAVPSTTYISLFVIFQVLMITFDLTHVRPVERFIPARRAETANRVHSASR